MPRPRSTRLIVLLLVTPAWAAEIRGKAEKVHEKTVRVVWKEKDRYGRIVGDVHLADESGDRNINIEMVHDGFAWWYKSYAPKSKTLEQAEAEAKKERRGLWHDKNPEPPWEYRKQERSKRK